MPTANDARFELYYWPSIQGRGEFVRLAFEAAGAAYVDVARLPEKKGGGVAAMTRLLDRDSMAVPPFAPPFLKMGDVVIAQTANILQFIAPRLGLVPTDDASRAWANQLQLTIGDFAGEVHDVHHPIATGLYYEDQKSEAKKRARHFSKDRLPKFLSYFEAIAKRNGSAPPRLLGSELSYVDLSAYQMVVGLEYAFPNAFERIRSTIPSLLRLRDHVAAQPRVAAYLASERRIPFNEQGIFRHYPELDP